jgi:hypothetical protein
MRTRLRSNRIMALLVITLAISACAKAPPNLSPAGTAAFYGTRVIHGLDAFRDIAISANENKLITTDATRAIVTYHKSAITVVRATPQGWQSTLLTGLDQLLANLQPDERQLLQPYVVLLRTILQEVIR